jgi:hypothetical protein
MTSQAVTLAAAKKPDFEASDIRLLPSIGATGAQPRKNDITSRNCEDGGGGAQQQMPY